MSNISNPIITMHRLTPVGTVYGNFAIKSKKDNRGLPFASLLLNNQDNSFWLRQFERPLYACSLEEVDFLYSSGLIDFANKAAEVLFGLSLIEEKEKREQLKNKDK